MNVSQVEPDVERLRGIRLAFSGRPLIVSIVVAVAGLLVTLAGCFFYEDPWSRIWPAYLVAFAWVLSISVGSLFFVLVQHLTRAGWSVVARRPAEILSLNIVLVAVLFLPIAWTVFRGSDSIYSWVDHSDRHSATSSVTVSAVSAVTSGGNSQHEGQHASPSKPYLSVPRFLVSWMIYFGVWVGLAAFYYRQSVQQDRNGSVDATRRMEWWSGIGTVLSGFAVTYASFDLLMFLDPSWYSTIFGVYFFAGCAIAGLAAILLTVLLLIKFNVVSDVVSAEVQRDLGRLLFAFVFFWAYIAFSQYMLLWYANVPETTSWLVRRGMSTATGYTNSWGWLAVVMLLAHFLIPFAGVMSRHIKSNVNVMIAWTTWLLVIHFFDLYWIVIPHWHAEFTVSFVEIGMAAAMLGLYLVFALWIASRNGLIPVGDPRLGESLRRHEVY